MTGRLVLLCMVVWLAAGSAPASAQLLAGEEGYALLLGSHHGGSRQASLRYAADDTGRVADLLTSLGGADALNLADQPVPLPELRARVEPLPATLNGEPVVLALPPGQYATTLREGDTAARCVLRLRDGAEVFLNKEQCTVLEQQAAEAKGERLSRAELRAERLAVRRAQRALEAAADVGKSEYFSFNFAFGFGFAADRDAYISRLQEFGYTHATDDFMLRVAVDVGYRLTPNFVLGLGYFSLSPERYGRFEEVTQRISWAGHALAAFVQADVAFGRRRFVNLFAKLGVGASLAWTHFDALLITPDFPDASFSIENTTARTHSVRQEFVRPCGFLATGMQLSMARYVGISFELRYVLAPAIRNRLAETRNLGGIDVLFGVRARTWE